MKRTPPKNMAGCPTGEQLSAFLDGEGFDELREHVENCPRCSRTLAAYRDIDDALRNLIRPPRQLASRIAAACRDAAPREQTRIFWFPRVFALAAAFAVLVGVAIVLIHTEQPVSGRLTARRPGASVPAGVVVYRSPRVTPLYARASGSGSRISPGDVRAAGMTAGTRRGAVLRVAVPPRVRHVWVVGDTRAMGRLLHSQLPRGAVCTPAGTDADMARYQVRIMDDALPGLVDRIARAGGALVSGMAPQPYNQIHGRRVVWLAQHRPVEYDIAFVRSKP